MRRAEFFSVLSVVQGVYYLLTAIWPFASARTFQRVTGPKTDFWLVQTVGMLVGVIGLVLTIAGLRRQTTREIPLLAVGSAVGLAAVDIAHVAQNRISRVYLLDAAAELALALGWAFVRRRGRETNLIGEILRRERDTSLWRGPHSERAALASER